jgi:8-oxo-dGDP phosphatase
LRARGVGGRRFEHHVVRLKRAAIAAVAERDRVLMMWRHRFVPDRWGWELPGGLVEDGEEPVVTAAREAERTEWIPLGEVLGLIAHGQIWGAGTMIALLHIPSSDRDGSSDEGG